jgi:hypothetical protein
LRSTDGVGHHRLAVAGTAYVRCEYLGGSVFVLDQIDRFLGPSRFQIDAQHLRALAREEDRRRLAVAEARPARAGARYDRHLVLQTSRHSSS